MGLNSSMDAFGLLQSFPSDGSTTARCQLLPFGFKVSKTIPSKKWTEIRTISIGESATYVFLCDVSSGGLSTQLNAIADYLPSDPNLTTTINTTFLGNMSVGGTWNGGSNITISVYNGANDAYGAPFIITGWVIIGL